VRLFPRVLLTQEKKFDKKFEMLFGILPLKKSL